MHIFVPFAKTHFITLLGVTYWWEILDALVLLRPSDHLDPNSSPLLDLFG